MKETLVSVELVYLLPKNNTRLLKHILHVGWIDQLFCNKRVQAVPVSHQQRNELLRFVVVRWRIVVELAHLGIWFIGEVARRRAGIFAITIGSDGQVCCSFVGIICFMFSYARLTIGRIHWQKSENLFFADFLRAIPACSDDDGWLLELPFSELLFLITYSSTRHHEPLNMIPRSVSRRSARCSLGLQKLEERRVLASLVGQATMSAVAEIGSISNTVPVTDGKQLVVTETSTYALTNDSVVVIGDETANDALGSMFVDHALVHYIQPAVSNYETPIVMVPGRNLSSSIFLQTPDGRESWAQMFSAQGYDVYVINDPNFDFSRGFNVSPFTVPTEGAPPADPGAQRAWQQDIWRRWGFGSSQGNPYPDTRFPTDQFDVFESNYPYVSSAGRSYSDALVSLLDNIGPSIVMAHSAGASVTVNAATNRPDLVKGMFMIEPAGPPDAGDFPALAGMSMLGVYGDYITSRNQTGRKDATEAAAILFEQFGGVGEVISLPEDHAIFGNTHLMMQDNNNDFIADLMLTWLTDNALGGQRDTPLIRGCTSTIIVASGLSKLAELPSGELLIVGTDTSSGDSAWTVDPVTGTVTATDVTAGPRILPWSQLAIDGDGHGVLFQQSASDVAVRSVDASATTTSVTTTSTLVPASTRALTSATGNRTVLAWNEPGGLSVMLWDNLNGTPISVPTTLPGYVEALGFDDATGLLALATGDGNLDSVAVDTSFSLAYSIDSVDGLVEVDGAMGLLATINSNGLLNWFDLQTGAKIAETTVDLNEIGSPIDIKVAADGVSTVLLTSTGVTTIDTPELMPAVEGVVINDGEQQRSALKSLSIQFNTLIDVSASALTLTNFGTTANPNNRVVTDFSVLVHDHGGKSTAIVTFTSGASTTDGNYQLDIDGSQVIRRDGAATISGDYSFGENATDDFFQLYGDADGNGFVDFSDFADYFLPAFGSEFGMSGYKDWLDGNHDDSIDFTDFANDFLPRFGMSR